VKGTDCPCLAGFSMRLGKGGWVRSSEEGDASRVGLDVWTLAFWWQRDGGGVNVTQGGGDDGLLFALHDDDGSGFGSIFVSVRGGTFIVLEVVGVEASMPLPLTSRNTTGWEHLAVSYNAASADDNVRLYVGGVEVSTATLNAPETSSSETTGFVFVGRDPTAKRKEATGIMVDEILAFPTVLSPLELAHVMQNDLAELLPAKPSAHITFDSLELSNSGKAHLEEHTCGLIYGQVVGCYQMMLRGNGLCPDVKNATYCMLFVHSVLVNASETQCRGSQPCLDSNTIRDSSSFLFWINLADMSVEILSSTIVLVLLLCVLLFTNDDTQKQRYCYRALMVEIFFQMAAIALTAIEVGRVYNNQLQDALDRLYGSRCVERNNDGIVTDLKSEFETVRYLAPAELGIAVAEMVFTLWLFARQHRQRQFSNNNEKGDDSYSTATQGFLDVLQALISVVDFYFTLKVTGSVDALFESVNVQDDVWCYEGQRLDAMCSSSAAARMHAIYYWTLLWVAFIVIRKHM